jgi:hypothetical protein
VEVEVEVEVGSMARYCTVAPTHILEAMKETKSLGRSHLLLAHDVVQHPGSYHTLFANMWGTGRSIIMDNSAYELKSAVDFKMVKLAVNIIGGSCCVVLPDHYLNGTNTAVDSLAAAHEWNEELGKVHGCTLMVIPQGEDFKEWVWCAEQLADDLPGVYYWGVPRNFREVLGLSRCIAIDVLRMLNPQRRIHLFGFSNDYVDDLISLHHDPHVTSIDSTTPIRAGSLGLGFNLGVQLPPRGDWWETAEWNPTILENLTYIRHLCRDPYHNDY